MDEALKALIESTATETRRPFDVVAEVLDQRFHALSEAISIVDEKLDRRTADLQERMDRGFTETQSMIQVLTRRSAILSADSPDTNA